MILLERILDLQVLEHHFLGPGAIVTSLANRLITVGLVATSLLIALTTCELGIVLELTGCMSATALAYILPPLCFLKLSGGSMWIWEKVASVVGVVCGVIVMILSTILTLHDAFHSTSTKDCRW